MSNNKIIQRALTTLAAAIFSFSGGSAAANAGNVSQTPLFVTQSVPPLTMLVMGRDHKLYYEAYNDASDLDGDGVVDVGYKPDQITYFGYFDSNKCYTYSSSKKRFEPTSAATNKKCSAAWSGDFLNYVTTARIDALRKVLYGGDRKVDTESETVLRRTHIPQDAHSWAKEYTSEAHDGYNISDYAPLSAPPWGGRHLFANVSTSNNGEPLMRVLTNTQYRAWDWVSIEGPVAGTVCNDGSGRKNCTSNGVGGSNSWSIVPANAFIGLQQQTWDTTGYNGSPGSEAAFDTVVKDYKKNNKKFNGVATPSTINGSGNPLGTRPADQDNYLTIFSGKLKVPTSGTWQFAVDGDDAVEFRINGSVVAHYYGAHAACNCQTNSGSIYLNANQEYSFEFRHHEATGGDAYHLYWRGGSDAPVSTLTDYTVDILACKKAGDSEPEASCKKYPNGQFKPTGLLQDYGETDRMLFGLITGSYAKNTSGGVLRKNIESFKDEVDLETGIFTAQVGIIGTINRLKTMGFNDNNYQYSCGWIATRPINEGECSMWGNPIAEMMYESLRYFSGTMAPLSAYSIAATGNEDATLGLPLPAWKDPYTGRDYCAKPVQLVISDINPSYDSDQLPGSAFSSSVSAEQGPLAKFHAENLANEISDGEPDIKSSLRYIGQSGNDNDGAPTPKIIESLGNVRGLAPEEPTKLGSYYAASAAYFGRTNQVSPKSDQTMSTYAVALASPLPRIEIPMNGGHMITLIPFAKSVGGYSISATRGHFQPTNQIVDFYIDTIVNVGNETDTTINGGRPYGKFRINFEDVEQGADHDMDAIVEYEFKVNDDDTVTINLDSTYAAGSIIQHMGYVISGTTKDGIYLDVRDEDTPQQSDPAYFLNTPPNVWADDEGTRAGSLPLQASRTFSPGTDQAATLLKDPLWYAAKWGGFREDSNTATGKPDDPNKWDRDGDGNPDNYFLVTNALGLKAQLSEAFNQILGEATSASSVATNSTRLDSGSVVYQARFNPENWSGQLLAYNLITESEDPKEIGSIGSILWDSSNQSLKPNPATRKVFTLNEDAEPTAFNKGLSFSWATLSDGQKAHLNKDHLGVVDNLGQDRVAYLRGDNTKEVRNGGTFRDRVSRDGLTPFWLGDIVNSDPVFVGTGNYGYGRPYSSGEGSDSYAAFVAGKKTRTPMIYVGANDGMLHGFDATTGAEKLAYVPNNVIPDLVHLTDPDYRHQYYVDSPPWAGDAYIGGWKTVLVGATGAGGRAVFALDVTNPDSFSADNVMWEFTHPDLGTAMGQPSIARLESGQWVAIFGNGSYSDNDKAALFILDLADGKLLRKIDLTDGSSINGLSTPVAVDINGNLNADYIYAGDLQGNMWKIDVRGDSEADWHISLNDSPLFQAKDKDGAIQPITHRPLVGLHDQGGLMVYFGTGKYFEVNDNQPGGQIQTFYGIRDRGTVVNRTQLQSQKIIYEGSLHGYDVRAVTANPVASTQNGWYLDLIYGENAQGERVVANPLLRNGRIIFTTIIPSQDACSFGGNSWLMEMDAMTGGRLHESVFDLNGDGKFDDLDFIEIEGEDGETIRIPVSGKRSNEGLIKTPGIISDGTKEYKYTSGSSGTIERTVESAGSGFGRQSWRQLR